MSGTRLYVIFGSYTEKLSEHLSPVYEIAGSDRTLEAAVATSRKLSPPPDVFLVLGSALASGMVEGRIDYGAALVRNLKELRKACPVSRVVVVLSSSADDLLVQEIAKLGIYDVHRVDEVRVDDLVSFIENPRTFADLEVGAAATGDPGKVSFSSESRASWLQGLLRRFQKEKPAYKERVQPTRTTTKALQGPLVVAVGFSLPGIPQVTVPPATAATVLFAPGYADRSLLPPGAKGYIVGTEPLAWRDAARTGLPVIDPGKATTLVDAGQSNLCVVVYSSSTAVGKTTVALNLASLLSKEKKVCLVDLDSGKPTLTELVTGRTDARGDLSAPVPTKWGFDFVPVVSEDVSLQDALAGFRGLLARCDVVVDCPGRLNLLPCMEAALRVAGRVLLISDCTNRSVAAVRNFAIGTMRELGITERTLLVVNRKEMKPFLKPTEVAERVGMPLSFELPFDPLVERMFGECQPLTHLKFKKSPFLEKLETVKAGLKGDDALVQPGVPTHSAS